MDLSVVFSPEGRLSKVSTADFVAWLRAELSSLEDKSAALGRLVALLKPGRDVGLADLPARFEKLDEIIRSDLRPAPEHLLLDEAGEFDREATARGLSTAGQLDPFDPHLPGVDRTSWSIRGASTAMPSGRVRKN